MRSLSALQKVHLVFALHNRCAGLAIVRELTSPKLATTNPDCAITFKIKDTVENPSLKLVFKDRTEYEVDMTHMHAGQVIEHIFAKIEARNMVDILTKNNFVGKQLKTTWGP